VCSAILLYFIHRRIVIIKTTAFQKFVSTCSLTWPIRGQTRTLLRPPVELVSTQTHESVEQLLLNVRGTLYRCYIHSKVNIWNSVWFPGTMGHRHPAVAMGEFTEIVMRINMFVWDVMRDSGWVDLFVAFLRTVLNFRILHRSGFLRLMVQTKCCSLKKPLIRNK
jgi:hypothetical protein